MRLAAGHVRRGAAGPPAGAQAGADGSAWPLGWVLALSGLGSFGGALVLRRAARRRDPEIAAIHAPSS
ncbi:hypothetical protein [Mangrovicoccus ximenensis]|uniref:hypothetical protein n=1 Tax=Mangrovicoccus ximenensis TaxID=1911570 RepID=UPI0011AEA3B9|nr:hypothetical protein [Mangrovicoccus ximenensis]